MGDRQNGFSPSRLAGVSFVGHQWWPGTFVSHISSKVADKMICVAWVTVKTDSHRVAWLEFRLSVINGGQGFFVSHISSKVADKMIRVAWVTVKTDSHRVAWLEFRLSVINGGQGLLSAIFHQKWLTN